MHVEKIGHRLRSTHIEAPAGTARCATSESSGVRNSPTPPLTDVFPLSVGLHANPNRGSNSPHEWFFQTMPLVKSGSVTFRRFAISPFTSLGTVYGLSLI